MGGTFQLVDIGAPVLMGDEVLMGLGSNIGVLQFERKKKIFDRKSGELWRNHMRAHVQMRLRDSTQRRGGRN